MRVANYLLSFCAKGGCNVRFGNYLLSFQARHLFYFLEMNYLQPSRSGWKP